VIPIVTNASFEFDLLEAQAAVELVAAGSLNCFQNLQWVNAVAAVRQRPHEFVVVRARSAGDAPAYLIGGVHSRMGVRVFESMPMMGYGGWVCERPLQVDEERRITCAWLVSCRWPLVAITSEPGRAACLPDSAVWPVLLTRGRLAAVDMETHRLDISGDDAALLARVRPSVRSYLRRAEQLDFSFARGGRELLGTFYDRYRHGSQGWQVAAAQVLPREFFEALCRDDGMEIWLVSQEGRPVGAAAFLVGAREVQYQASGTERVAGPISAMDALIWHAARHYRDRGFKTMNMGASEGLDSVRRFKQKFGAVAVGYRRVWYPFPRWVTPLGA
jgi:Acetyltransferase (GNAT) domain